MSGERAEQAARAVADQLDETLDREIGGGERLGDRFGRGPALAAVAGDALGFVEGGGVEAGALGKARGRQPGTLGEPVERGPDLAVGEKAGFGWLGHGITQSRV